MPNAAIPRERVHELAEACSDEGPGFQQRAARLIKEQRRLTRFFEQNMAELSPKLHDLHEELAQVSELLDEARATDTLDPRFAGLSNLVVGLMDVEIRTLQLVDALARHALA